MSIFVEYSCARCGIAERGVAVRERGPAETLPDWTKSANLVIAADHRLKSPACSGPAIAIFDIPLPAGVDTVGRVA